MLPQMKNYNGDNTSYDEIRQAIEDSPTDSTVYIGADSQVFKKKGGSRVTYVTVIILHYGTSKGATIFKAHDIQPYYGQLRLRLMGEVQRAIDSAMEVVDSIGERSFEIHLDINRGLEHKSSAILKEATGYVLGMLGIQPKLKPNSFAASSVADRFCHHK